MRDYLPAETIRVSAFGHYRTLKRRIHDVDGTSGTVRVRGEDWKAKRVDGRWECDITEQFTDLVNLVFELRRTHGEPIGDDDDTTYGSPLTSNPFDFHIDFEACTKRDMENWIADAERYLAGETIDNPGHETVVDATGRHILHISRTSWGYGVTILRGAGKELAQWELASTALMPIEVQQTCLE